MNVNAPASAGTARGHLQTRSLSVSFGGHQAVREVSCSFTPGTLTCIVGPNGAGKTTYFNLISGQIPATAGSVLLDGRDLTRLPASARAQAGLGRAFQLTNLFPGLSVRENIRLAVQAARKGPHRRGFNLWSIASDHVSVNEEADRLLESVAMHALAGNAAASLSHGNQRKLEVALMMALDPAVYMFDEPTAGMSADDTPVVLDLIRALRAKGDRTLLLVEHKMDVVRELADRIIVLHQGALVADGDPASVMASPVVQEAYLGTAVDAGVE
jgi:branched-chain amino acid transport system ATP-binding protein